MHHFYSYSILSLKLLCLNNAYFLNKVAKFVNLPWFKLHKKKNTILKIFPIFQSPRVPKILRQASILQIPPSEPELSKQTKLLTIGRDLPASDAWYATGQKSGPISVGSLSSTCSSNALTSRLVYCHVPPVLRRNPAVWQHWSLKDARALNCRLKIATVK